MYQIRENPSYNRLSLVGTVERFNDGKRAEEHDRVKHTFQEEESECKNEKEGEVK